VIDNPDAVVVQPRLGWATVEPVAFGTNPVVSGTVTTVGPVSAAGQGPSAGGERFFERFLRVKNTTAEPMKVYVQFHTQVDDNQWAWVPADPGDSAKSVMLQVSPGQEATLADNEGPIPADRVRIWAVGSSKRIQEHRSRDLWLVPEVNADGDRAYLAPDMQTFTYVLR
jgi:hypothetical protein